jgi:hypothetical protein
MNLTTARPIRSIARPPAGRRRSLLLGALAVCALLPGSAIAAPTDPDTGYGTGGRTVTSFGDGVSTQATAAVRLAGGAVMVGGSTIGTTDPIKIARYAADGTLAGTTLERFVDGDNAHVATGTTWTHERVTRVVFAGGRERNLNTKDLALLAVDAGGARDASFGADGLVLTASADDVYATVEALVPNGAELIAVGSLYDNSAGTYGYAIARYAWDGTPLSFETVVFDAAVTQFGDMKAALLASGDLVVAANHTAGIYLARHTAASRFADLAAPATFRSGAVQDLLVTDRAGEGEKVVVAGSADGAMLLARLSPSLAVDTAFGENGTAQVSFGEGVSSQIAYAVTRDDAGRFLLAGRVVTTEQRLAFARLLATGQPDSAFAAGGRAMAAVSDQPVDVDVRPDGRIVVAGDTGVVPRSFAVSRYLGGDTAVTDPPAVQILAPTADQWRGVGPAADVISGTMSTRPGDAESVTVRLYEADGALRQTIAAPRADGMDTWTATAAPALADGTYGVEVVQTSVASGTTTTPRLSFRVDRATPAPTLTAPLDGAILGGPTQPVFSGARGTQAQDASHSADGDVFPYRCAVVAGVVQGTCTTPAATQSGTAWTSTVLVDQPDGTYEVTARQSDGALNEGRSPAIRVKLDRTAPALAVVAPGEGSLLKDRTPTFSGTRGVLNGTAETSAADKAPVALRVLRGTTEVQTRTDAETGPSWTFPTATLADGGYVLEAVQEDVPGNTATRRAAFAIDATAPALGLDLGEGAALRTAAPTFGGPRGTQGPDATHAADTPTVTVRVLQGATEVRRETDPGDGAAWGVSTGGLQDGTYALEVEQQDALGNTATITRGFSIDTAPPKPVIESPVQGQQVPRGDLRITGRGDPNREIDVQVTKPLEGTGTIKAQVGADGRWSATTSVGTGLVAYSDAFGVRAQQTDAAGNTGQSGYVGFTVGERPPPPPPPSNPPSGGGGSGTSLLHQGDPSSAPTGGETLPPAAGGCEQKIVIGPLQATGTCFRREGQGLDQVWVTSGAVAMNGVSFVPNGAGAKLILDPIHLRVAAQGQMSVQLNYRLGVLTLYKGAFNWEFKGPKFTLPSVDVPGLGKVDLTKYVPRSGASTRSRASAVATKLPNGWKVPANVDAKGISFDPLEVNVGAAAKLLGLPITGKAVLVVQNLKADLHVNIGLPKAFGGFTGETDLHAEYGKGLVIESMDIAIPQMWLGAVEVRDFRLGFSDVNNQWDGGATVLIPPLGNVGVGTKITIKDGKLTRFHGLATGMNHPVAPGFFLDEVEAEFKTEPVITVAGRVKVAAGPNIFGKTAASINGNADITFGQPMVMNVRGNLNLVDKELASAWVKLQSTPTLDFGGKVNWSLFGVGVTGALEGWVDGASAFQAHAQANLDFGVLGKYGGELIVSNVGAGGCAKGVFLVGQLGFGYRWSGKWDFWKGSCGIGDYKGARTVRLTQPGVPQTVIVPKTPTASLAFKGQGGAPLVTLLDPSGKQVIATPADAPATRTPDAVLMKNEEADTTYVALGNNPAPGAWKLVLQPGSVPLVSVDQAQALPEPKITARVTGKGRTRKIAYKMAPIPGVEVQLSEEGPQTKQVIGKFKGAAGTLTFKPGNGRGGRRDIVALVTQGGMPWKTVRVATYVAPAPVVPSTPRKLKAVRQGKRLAVTWRRGRAVDRWTVELSLKGGRRLTRIAKGTATGIRIPLLGTETTGAVIVRGIARDGHRGKAGRTTFRPVKRQLAKRRPVGARAG